MGRRAVERWNRARARKALLVIGVPILSGMLIGLILTEPNPSVAGEPPSERDTAAAYDGAAAPDPAAAGDDREPRAANAAVEAAEPRAGDAPDGNADQQAQGRPSITPEALRPILGPLALKGSGPAVPGIRTYDDRFARTEQARYDDYVKVEQDRQGAFLLGHHYGGLISRLMWSIRTSAPIGPSSPPENVSAYARGRRIVRRYLEWSKRNGYSIPPHNNTGMADIEALYVLEGDEDALTHIHVAAMSATTDRYGYLQFRNPKSDARQVAVALQAFMAAHRLGIPFERSRANNNIGFDAELGSWLAAARRQIGWVRDNGVKADGAIPSPSHGGHEAYLFNALLATRLLEWCANIEWDPEVFGLAQRIMDHLIDARKPALPALGYQSNSPQAATDLAAFYIWPSLVLWQETGDPKYRDFAIQNIGASSTAYIDQMKQWNQIYSTLGQGAEALLARVSWR
ncbi:MAG TPA: hypothetical protein VMM79_16515 [Longimicrobiales bacterium]|nr:hypothetical protein [Longimicrobiales bacterium]